MKKIFVVLLLILLITPVFAFAVANPCQITSSDGSTPPSSLPKCVNQIYVWSLGLAALLAVLMVVLGGYLYMTAAGNAEQATKGKEYIWSSLIGLILLFLAYLLLNTINPDLVNFNTNSINCLDNPTAAGCPTAPPPRE